MISKHAEIAPNVKLGKNVHIGPFSVIYENVEIGDDVWIGSHVVIKGHTKIGSNNKIYQFASIGEDCQDKKYQSELSFLEIGNHNIFREGVTVHRGTLQGGSKTIIGDHNLFMVNAHIAHDCIIGNHIVFANGASVAGHVSVADYANLAGLVGVHQFCAIGAYSFVAGGSIVHKDVLPYTKVSGYPAQVYGLNTVGLERNGFSLEEIELLKQAYKIIFVQSKTVPEAIDLLRGLSFVPDKIELLIEFLLKSARGIVR